MNFLSGALLGILVFCSGCSSGLREPIPLDSAPGHLNLRTWNFQVDSPVVPQNWAWDPGVLWSPDQGGRPTDLPPAVALGPPDRGGAFHQSLMRSFPSMKSSGLASATAHLEVLTTNDRNLGVQIGVIPGAFRVWANGILVWEQGVLSMDPARYRAGGSGTILTVQPYNGVVDLVVDVVTSDPLVRHSESNRHWVLGPAEAMMESYRTESGWRSLQAAVLIMGILVFLWISVLRPDSRNLLFFVAFLAVCLLKLYANVEQPEPLLYTVFPSVSLCLFLNHGLNLLPFPLLMLYLVRQFPNDISFRSVWIFSILTLAVSLWELLPFVVLAFGWETLYALILQAPWHFILNFYVVVATLYIFERLYQTFVRKRPLSAALFLGGIFMGLLVLLPVPLSYFMAVKYTYFLGWGMFLFLGTLTFEVVRLQIRTDEAKWETLGLELVSRETLTKFLSPEWASRLARDSRETIRPGDSRSDEAILVQIRSTGTPESWLPPLGKIAVSRHAILVDWRENLGIWALDSWSETALAFALEAQACFRQWPEARFSTVVTKALIRYHVLDLSNQWLPAASGLPRARLEELGQKAERYGAAIVLDSVVRDGLAIGGWRRHRWLSVEGTEIEFYEAEEETVAQLKDKTLESFESALGLARTGQTEEAVQALFAVVQENPFDQAALAFLSEWGQLRHR